MLSLESAGASNVLIVGGWVRDAILGLNSKDVDIEVFGMELDMIQSVLENDGHKVDAVGKAFGVLKLNNEIDISVPRRDNHVGVGHKGFKVSMDPLMSVTEAASRRDFTINSMACGLDGEIIDPFRGLNDLKKGFLRAASCSFVEDPLRVMRAMQFASRFNMRLEGTTRAWCREMASLKSQLPKERMWEEWKKWALKGARPSLGLCILDKVDWLDPEIKDLINCPQDPEWHPEGWLAFVPNEQEILSINSGLASPTQSIGIEDRLCFGEFLSRAIAKFTTSPSAHGATSAQSSEVDFLINSLTTASPTRTSSLSPPTTFSKAVGTQPVSFVGHVRSVAPRADKTIRIMLEVSQSSMHCIMRSSVNDLQIVDVIVTPISIFMMNMLFGSEWATKFQFHKDAVKSNRPLFTGPANVSVSIIVANSLSLPVNGNILISFDLSFEGDIDFIHNDFLVVDKNDPSLLYTKITQGDVFEHTCHVVDEAAIIATREQLDEHDRLVLMFAALTHDLGKVTTTRMIDGRLRSRGHCQEGVEPAERFMRGIGVPNAVIAEVLPLVAEHLIHAGVGEPSPRAVRRLAKRLVPSSIHALGRLGEADHSGRPPLPKGNPLQVWVSKASEIGVSANCSKSILSGRHLIELGMNPGVKMGKVLHEAFEAQLDGKFHDLDSAMVWLSHNTA
jgi:putative nucleotidyltransferase with HDIG domain